MTNFIGTQLTKKGLALIAKSGLTVTFTKAETGSGIYDEKEDISTMTELKEKKQSFSINSALKKTETQANVKFVVSNKELTEGYLFTEIGLYALDPDEGEILYAVCYSTPKNATELQAYNGVFEASVIMSLLVDISNDGNVVIDPQGVYALEEDLCVTNEKLNHIADCLGDHTIKSNVPENAVFTDTVYDDTEVKEDVNTLKKETTVNLLKPTKETIIQDGVTFTNNNDGTYTMNGNAAKDIYDSLKIFTLPKGKYKIVGAPSSYKNHLYITKLNDFSYVKYSDEEFEVTDSSQDYSIVLRTYTGSNYTNIIFKPMVTTNLDATYDDFVPYTGNAGSVNGDVAKLNSNLNGHTVNSDVPDNAKFTDTVVGVQNNLVSTLTDEALSAAQGKILNDKITDISISKANVSVGLGGAVVPESGNWLAIYTGGGSSGSTSGMVIGNGSSIFYKTNTALTAKVSNSILQLSLSGMTILVKVFY